MKTTIEQVQEFHDAFPTNAGKDPFLIKDCRLTLLKEELKELEDAVQSGNQIEILDALTDLQYVLDGTYIVFGFASVKDAAFREVHRSNMSKLGPDGKAIFRADGKVLKGPGYSPPNLAQFI